MLTGISISLQSSDRARLIEIAANRNSPQKHVWRAQIVLLSADGVDTNEIMRVTSKAKTGVSKTWGVTPRAGLAGGRGVRPAPPP